MEYIYLVQESKKMFFFFFIENKSFQGNCNGGIEFSEGSEVKRELFGKWTYFCAHPSELDPNFECFKICLFLFLKNAKK